MNESLKISAQPSGKEKQTTADSTASDLLSQGLDALGELFDSRDPASETPIHAGQPNTDEFHPTAKLAKKAAACSAEKEYSILPEDIEADELSDECSDLLSDFPDGSLVDGVLRSMSDSLADAFN